MIPSISQQLAAMKVRMEETIVPELPPEAKFAHEQARFILTTLEWLLDTHEHEYRYEVVENAEYRKLTAELLKDAGSWGVDAGLCAAADKVLTEKGPASNEAVIPVRSVVAQNRRLKKAAMDIYSALSEKHGSQGNPARGLLSDVSIRQGRREVAFFRKTEWVSTEDRLGDLLGESRG